MAAPAISGGQPGALSLTRLRSTPALMRAMSVGITIVIAVAAVLAFLAAQELVRSTDELEQNVVPVLITSQGLVASLAEADAANTSVFLSGADEDRQQRRLYELAVERAPRQIEDVSALIGDDAVSHNELKDVGSGLTAYVATVEQARAANLAGNPDATNTLGDAIELMNGPDGILTSVDAVTERARSDFSTTDDTADLLTVAAFAAIVAAVLALIAAQGWLRSKTKRTFNPSMVLATFALVALALWLSLATVGRSNDLSDAEQNASAAIFETSAIQTEAFALKTTIESALIDGESIDQTDLAGKTETVRAAISSLTANADTNREQAAADELLTRFDRYASTTDRIAQEVAAGQTSLAIERSIGDGNRDFNGFNTAIESVLSDNRDQFFTTASNARARLDWLRLGTIVLPVLAAALALLGWQARINEYW